MQFCTAAGTAREFANDFAARRSGNTQVVDFMAIQSVGQTLTEGLASALQRARRGRREGSSTVLSTGHVDRRK